MKFQKSNFHKSTHNSGHLKVSPFDCNHANYECNEPLGIEVLHASIKNEFEHRIETEMLSVIKSMNIHINGFCNYRCGFCFAGNLVHNTMTPSQWKPIFHDLKKWGINKINFAGGEPTMHPQFIELCGLAKSMNFTVSVVTNSSKIDHELIQKMKGVVDWIGLSVDSPDNEVEKAVGRQCAGINHIENVIKVADLAHETGIKVKLNITVICQSWKQNFSDLIRRVDPERVKAFQVLRIEGTNEDKYDEYSITEEEWKHFTNNHEDIILQNGEKIVFEGCDDMIDSYFMLDPMGRIMRNSGNTFSDQPYSDLISGGIESIVSPKKYHERGAVYEWGVQQ